MTKKMLIDAAHPEEVRVALIDQGKVEDFDFESASRKPLRGNIYLARVTRVEPSLQAAFVEYGGNRHGFLAFNEIHPDYYQIPVSDRQILQEAEAEEAALAAELELMQRGDETNDDGDIQMGASDEDDGEDDADDSVDETNEDEDAAAEASSDETDDDDNTDVATDDEDPKLKSSGDDDVDPDKDADGEEEEEEEADEEDDAEDEASSDVASAKTKTEDYDPEAIADGEQPVVELDDPQTEPSLEVSQDDQISDDDFAEDIAENGGADDGDSEIIELADKESDDEDSEEAESADDAEETENPEKTAKREAAKARAALFERYKEAKRKRARLVRNYKIQEVVKRRQILLIQVVKEERGNKGAALTTYLSLAGRYCVLMPNTARGGGISRKIPSVTDRRRLRRVVDSLDLPQGMGLIIRTAGAKRTKVEIKRDYDYLIRLWESIRSLTLKSIAPCLVYEEASLIKRAIRDLYDKDISNVLVEGEAGYREAKDFMKMLMPSHAKNVQPYKDTAPIFLKHNVENQLDGMYQPSVRLKSGGYIVIHQTEALVAIDVNSGRSTRERNIELTATKTNIEAAQETARQCRLRDLAGLIVIDFIDMEEQKNNRKVEKALKEALKADRARIQTSRISNFGLLEMSRQRRRSGIVDGTTNACPTCSGAGVVRSNEMAAVRILRAIEGEAVSGKVGLINVRTSLDVSLFILNHKRDWLKRIEDDNGVSVEITADSSKAGDQYDLEKSGAPRERKARQAYISADQTEISDFDENDQEAIADADERDASSKDDDRGGKKKRRRRRKRKDTALENGDASNEASEQSADNEQREQSASDDDSEDKPKRRRRRGRRGGRRNRRDKDTANGASAENGDSPESQEQSTQPETASDDAAKSDGAPEETAASDAPAVEAKENKPKKKSNGARRKPKPKADETPQAEEAPAEAKAETKIPEPPADIDPPAPKKPARKGWWQRVIDS